MKFIDFVLFIPHIHLSSKDITLMVNVTVIGLNLTIMGNIIVDEQYIYIQC